MSFAAECFGVLVCLNWFVQVVSKGRLVHSMSVPQHRSGNTLFFLPQDVQRRASPRARMVAYFYVEGVNSELVSDSLMVDFSRTCLQEVRTTELVEILELCLFKCYFSKEHIIMCQAAPTGVLSATLILILGWSKCRKNCFAQEHNPVLLTHPLFSMIPV